MQTFCFIVFLVSAIALPWVAFAVAYAKMPLPGKLILFAGLALAARYLLGAIWIPDGLWPLRIKAAIIGGSGMQAWMFVLAAMRERRVRAWFIFAFCMLFPLAACFVFFSGTFVTGGFVAGDRAWWSAGFSSLLGNALFWAFWTVVSYLNSFASPASKAARVCLFAVAVVSVAMFVSADLRDRAAVAGGNALAAIRENVARKWPTVNKQAAKIVAAWEAAVEKDRKLVAGGKVGTGKLKAATNIGHDVRKLRRDLLPMDSRTLLSALRRKDAEIEVRRKSVSSLRERRLLVPEKAESLDSKIAKEEAALAKLESDRADIVAKTREELKSIGLDLPEGSVFLTVDLGELIDNAIVAKNIGFVVENLKALVDADKGDTETAKRYYGAYIVMLDVQSECFKQYLGKAASGIWRDGIAAVAKDAEAAKKGNEAKAAAEGRTEEEKAAFLHAAATNEKTLKAAQTYLAVLRRHEDIIKEKLAATEKRHEIALSFWESVDIASAFGAKAVSDMTDFEALLELKLPEIAFFDDAAMQEEFDAITQKLMKE